MGFDPFLGEWRDDESDSGRSSSSSIGIRSTGSASYDPFNDDFFGVERESSAPDLPSSRVYDERAGGYVDPIHTLFDRAQESVAADEAEERAEAQRRLDELRQYELYRDYGPLGAGAMAATGAAVEGGLGLLRGIGTAGRQIGEVIPAMQYMPGTGFGPAIEEGVDWLSETAPVQELTEAADIGRTLGAVPSFGLDLAAQAPQLAGAAVAPMSALLPMLGVSSAGSAAQEAEEAGAGEFEQLAHGAVSGTVEALAERFGALPVIGRIVSGVPGAAAGGIGKTVLRAMRGEFGEESMTSLAQEASRSGILTGFEDWDTTRALFEAAYEGGIGAVSGGGAVAAASPFAAPPFQEPPPELPIDTDPTHPMLVDPDPTLPIEVDLGAEYDPTVAEATGRFYQEDSPTDPAISLGDTAVEAVPLPPAVETPTMALEPTYPALVDPESTDLNAAGLSAIADQTQETDSIDPLAAAMDATSSLGPSAAPPAPVAEEPGTAPRPRRGPPAVPPPPRQREFDDTWAFPNPVDQPAYDTPVQEQARRAAERRAPPPQTAPPAAQAAALDETTDGFASQAPTEPIARPAPAQAAPPPATETQDLRPPAPVRAAEAAPAPTPRAEAPAAPAPAADAAEEQYVPEEAVGIAAKLPEVDSGKLKSILKRYGTSLGAWTKPAKMVIEAAKSERSATRGEAMELSNALTRLQIRFLKEQHGRVESGKLPRDQMLSKSKLEALLTGYLEGDTGVAIPDPKMVPVLDRMREIVTGLQTQQTEILEADWDREARAQLGSLAERFLSAKKNTGANRQDVFDSIDEFVTTRDIDALPKAMQFMGKKLVGNRRLAETFRENIGKRLTRSYQAFEDPKRIDKLKKTGEWETIKREISALPEFRDQSSDQVEAAMVQMADRDPISIDFQKGGGQGTIYTGIFKQRQDLPEPVRRLLGEHKHATQKFFRTVDRLQRNVATHTLYSNLRKIGLKEGWLSKTATGAAPIEIPGRDTRNPIGGLFISRAMRDVLLATERGGYTHPLVRTLSFLTGAVKWNKTVGSVQSQARNFIGNGLLKSGSGNAGGRLLPWNRIQNAQKVGIARSIREAKSETGGGTTRALEAAEEMGALGQMDLGQRRAAFNEAARYGLVDTNPDVQDLRNFFGEDGLFAQPEGLSENMAFRLLKRVKSGAEFFYRMGDATYKIDAWYNEQNKLAYYHPEMSESKRKQLAADRVKDFYPTSERQPEAIQILRRQPVIGGFISFVSDIPRVAKNINKVAGQEITEGRRTGNRKMQAVGWHRLASFYGSGVLAAETLALTLKAVRSALSEDEEDKPSSREELMLRPLLPQYLDASRTPIVARGVGWAVAMDLSFADPWASLKKPVTAFMRSLVYDAEGIDRAAWEGAKTFFEPYLQASPSVGPIMEAAWLGKTKDGRVIWNQDDPASTKIEKSIAHLAKRYEPGTLTTAGRLVEGAKRGSKEFGTEALAVVGPRLLFLDVEERLPMVANDYKRRQIDASSSFTRKWHPRYSDGDREKAKTESIEMYRRNARDLVAAVETAKGLRWTNGQIRASLRASRISEEVVSMAFRGEDAMVSWYEKKLREDERDLRQLLKERTKKAKR